MGLRDAASAAHQQKTRELNDYLHQQRMSMCAEAERYAERRLGFCPDSVDWDPTLRRIVATFDKGGLRLIYTDSPHPGTWHVLNPCPRCGALVESSTPCRDLLEIGAALDAGIQPFDDHRCAPSAVRLAASGG